MPNQSVKGNLFYFYWIADWKFVTIFQGCCGIFRLCAIEDSAHILYFYTLKHLVALKRKNKNVWYKYVTLQT